MPSWAPGSRVAIDDPEQVLVPHPEGHAEEGDALTVNGVELVEPVDWLFSGDPVDHTLALDDDSSAYGPEGSTIAEVLGRFWDGGPMERVVFE